MTVLVRAALRGALLVLGVLSLGAQLLIAFLLVPTVHESLPEAGFLAVPAVIWSIALIACGQTVLVVLWILVSYTEGPRIFSETAFVLIRVMIGAVALATALVLLGFVALNVVGFTPPSVMLGLLGAVVLGIVLALVLVVMTGLLRRAAALDAELEQVI